MENLKTKDDLLQKLRSYADNPDDDVIRIKKRIEGIFKNCPEILYALNEKNLEEELFKKDGTINWEWNETENKYEPLGEWDRYFGANSNIRPFLFIPQTQAEVKHFVCYQVDSDDALRANSYEKLMIVTFNVFVHGNDVFDKLTGIPRHDLLASIIREKFSWLGVECSNTVPTRSRESVTDNNYLTRTIKYECIMPNDLVMTQNNSTYFKNKRW